MFFPLHFFAPRLPSLRKIVTTTAITTTITTDANAWVNQGGVSLAYRLMAIPPTAHNEQYPVGPPDHNPSIGDRAMHIAAIQSFPEQFAAAYDGLGAEQLDTPYREGGWTLRQLAHHMADSHMNAWVRLKLAVTEDWPTIKAYNEKLWAETAEVSGSIDLPMTLLPPLHAHMTTLLESLTAPQWERGYVHPENGRKTIAQVVALYSWHGRHHTAHVLELRKRRGW